MSDDPALTRKMVAPGDLAATRPPPPARPTAASTGNRSSPAPSDAQAPGATAPIRVGGLRGGKLAAYTVAIMFLASGATLLLSGRLRPGVPVEPPLPTESPSPAAEKATAASLAAGTPVVPRVQNVAAAEEYAEQRHGKRGVLRAHGPARSAATPLAPVDAPAAEAPPPAAPEPAAGGSPYDEIMGAPHARASNAASASKDSANAKNHGAAAPKSTAPAQKPDGDDAPGESRGSKPAAANPSLYLGDGQGEEAPPSADDLADEKAAEVYASGIKTIVRMHRAQVSSCYERVFKDDQDAPHRARVELSFTVGADGKAHDVKTTSNSTGRDALAACLQQRVEEWKFPIPPEGEFQASYPFVISSGGR